MAAATAATATATARITPEEQEAIVHSLLPFCRRIAEEQLSYLKSVHPSVPVPEVVPEEKLKRAASILFHGMAELMLDESDTNFDVWLMMNAAMDLHEYPRVDDCDNDHDGEFGGHEALVDMLRSCKLSKEDAKAAIVKTRRCR